MVYCFKIVPDVCLKDVACFGVVLPRSEVESSYQHDIASLPNNKLYVARIANVTEAATYAKKAGEKWQTKHLGNWHQFKENVNFDEPQGRVLFLNDNNNGLNGNNNLNNNGRFVGIVKLTMLGLLLVLCNAGINVICLLM